MQLANQTAFPATVTAADHEGVARRIGLLTAKATFKFDAQGKVEIDTQEPFPLLSSDEKTPLGYLPSDAQPRADTAFEVVLLGHAYAPKQHPVTSLTVALNVGEARREITVFGDRAWVPGPSKGRAISRPQPFVKMPLTYQRAFGGAEEVNLDRESVFELSDRTNRHGIGFDAERMARELGIALKAPAGYPSLPPKYVRRLPNLENPRALIARPEDEPEPTCWATVPVDVAIWQARTAKEQAIAPRSRSKPVPGPQPMPQVVAYRAHPDWVVPLPKTAPKIRLENLVESARLLELTMPELSLVADYTIDGRIGSRPMLPQTLVLLPDQARFYVVYRLPFQFAFQPGSERSIRLRMEPRWFRGAS
jgi:hypothetical protein